MALINIQVTRTSNFIPYELPYVIFGLNDFYSGYYETIIRQIANNTILKLVSVTIGDPSILNSPQNFVCIKYKTFHGTDNIYITCNEIAYPSLLTSTMFNNFEIDEMNYTISKSNLIPFQFLQKINIQKISLFGKEIIDSYTPNQFRSDLVKLNDFITLPIKQKITAETNFSQKMVNDGGGGGSQYTISYSLNIKK